MAQVNVDTVIAAYVKLRDKRAELKKAYADEDEALKTKMERLEVYLLENMQKTGTTQLGSEHGTAYQQTTMKGNCSDWPSFWSWVAETGNFDFIQKRVSVAAIQQYYEENNELPPGVNVTPELKVIVRRN